MKKQIKEYVEREANIARIETGYRPHVTKRAIKRGAHLLLDDLCECIEKLKFYASTKRADTLKKINIEWSLKNDAKELLTKLENKYKGGGDE